MKGTWIVGLALTLLCVGVAILGLCFGNASEKPAILGGLLFVALPQLGLDLWQRSRARTDEQLRQLRK